MIDIPTALSVIREDDTGVVKMLDPMEPHRVGYITKDRRGLTIHPINQSNCIVLDAESCSLLEGKLPPKHYVPVVRHNGFKSVSINGVRLNLSQEDVDRIHAYGYTWLYVV